MGMPGRFPGFFPRGTCGKTDRFPNRRCATGCGMTVRWLSGSESKVSPGDCDKFKKRFRESDHGESSGHRSKARCKSKRTKKNYRAQYSNLVMIHHNLEEFTLNFIYIFPNGAQGKLPEHDRQPRPRQAHLARAGRKYRALRSAIRHDQGVSGSEPTPTVGFVQ